MRNRLGVLAAFVTGCAIFAGSAAASSADAAVTGPVRSSAPAVVLISQPQRSVCVGHKFTIGVWFQRISGGSRRYRVAVTGPRRHRFFYRAGVAPSGHWRSWHVLAGRRGRYVTVYSGHRAGSAKWTRFRAVTRAHRCS
jgi:hypothetical protein